MRRPFLLISLTLTLCAAHVQAAPASVTVQKGDTLYSLSRQHRLSVQQLRDLNGLKDNTIQVGQVLKLTGSPAVKPAPASTQAKQAVRPPAAVKKIPATLAKPTGTTPPTRPALKYNAQGDVIYTVKSGDTLGNIAERHHTSIRYLKAMNGLTGDTLMAGQTLRLLDLEGNQAVDTLFFSAKNPRERYDPQRTLRRQNRVYLTTGTVLYSNLGNPLLTITADTCGRHDTLGGACAHAGL